MSKMTKIYDPKFEQDFLRHIPASLKERYLRYLVLNLGLLASKEGVKDDIKQFVYFLISRESLDIVKKEGSVILYNENILEDEA